MTFYKKRIFSYLLFLSSIFLIVYLYYRSEVIWNGNNEQYYRIYKNISYFLIIFSIVTFFLSSKIYNYLIIILLSTILSLYSFEFYTALNKNKDIHLDYKKEIYKKQTGENYDVRSVEEVYEDLKKIDKTATVKVNPSNYLNYSNNDIFPLSGISKSKTVYQNENGYYMIYDSDRYGFNNPDDQWDNNEIEYLLIGDSFVHGAAVNRPDDIASVLRFLSGKKAISLGYSANGPLIELASLVEYFGENNSLTARNVLWFFTDNDIQGLIYELENELLKRYLHDENFKQNLLNKQDEVDSIAQATINKVKSDKVKFNIIRNLKLYNIRDLIFNLNKQNKQDNLLIPEELHQIFLRVKNISNLKQSNLFFIYIPDPRLYFDNNYSYYIRENIKKIIENLNIPIIDIHELLSLKETNIKKLYPFEQFGHYNPDGYNKVASEIYNYIVNF